MPMEFRLELMPVIRSNIVYPERKKFNHIIYKVNGVGLGVSVLSALCSLLSCISFSNDSRLIY